MPPSPSLRCSPGREQRKENTHKRGLSFESGLIHRAKDDDLTLFNDMQNKERECFLLQPADDFDDSLSKLRYISDFKLGITIPARGESSDLLNADGEKNDYDWLLTPPDTPLFPSLDDEEPPPQNMPPRGRPRSLPINISRLSSNNDSTCRNSRSSASPHRLSPSPHRLSPSPRSSNNIGQIISRPSSAPRSSPPPVIRPGTPSRRPSTPPNKPSTPTLRSSTPTPRRMSTGSSGQASSSGRRGPSPMRASRGNTASPKLQGLQSNLPGFSSEAPPNLRTSIPDRPSPHARGLSPTPRSGRGRHSMSPVSRSVSSSHSNDRDLFSSYSKGSVVSSGDDDVDSLHSVAIPSSPPVRRNVMSMNIKPMAFSKKPSKTSPSSSVPKRSFDSALRQMDHHKTPQNMFRPLLSSVPSTTFYVGKANSTHQPLFSRNSSLTTTTSASSDQGASVVPDKEGSEHDRNDLTDEWERTPNPDNHEEMFIFDKVDDVIEDSGQELHAGTSHIGTGSFDTDSMNKVDARECEESTVNPGGVECLGFTVEKMHADGDLSMVEGCEVMAVCSKCGKRFHLLVVNRKTDVCQECMEIDGLIATRESSPLSTPPQNQRIKPEITIGTDTTVDDVQLSINVHELPERSGGEVILGPYENNIEKGLNCLDNSCHVQSAKDESEPHLFDQQLDNPQVVSFTESHSGSKFVQTESTGHPSIRIDTPEGTGISILLQQRSSKLSVVQSRPFSATNILCAEPSYVRDNSSAMRRSIGRDSASASSVDMGSSLQIDGRIQRQISSRKIEMDCVRSDPDVKSQCIGSHSDVAFSAYALSFPSKNDTEESCNHSTKGAELDDLQESITGGLEISLDLTDRSAANFSTCNADFVDSDGHINADCLVAKNPPNSQLLSHLERHHYENLPADNLMIGCPSCINAKEDPWGENGRSSLDIEAPNNIPDSFIIEEQSVLHGPACRSDISDTTTNSSSGVILESHNDCDSFQDIHNDCGHTEKPSNKEAAHEQSVSTTLEKDVHVSSLESDLDDHAPSIHEESTLMVEGPGGHMSRSLTLAEATDTILFCSSIIHDIAYKAATIGMEKALALPPDSSRPMVTIVGKSVNDQNDSRKIPSKHAPKSLKFRRKKLETPTKMPLTESGNNVIVQGSIPSENPENITTKAPDSIKPPKLESKCNCTVM